MFRSTRCSVTIWLRGPEKPTGENCVYIRRWRKAVSVGETNSSKFCLFWRIYWKSRQILRSPLVQWEETDLLASISAVYVPPSSSFFLAFTKALSAFLCCLREGENFPIMFGNSQLRILYFPCLWEWHMRNNAIFLPSVSKSTAEISIE